MFSPLTSLLRFVFLSLSFFLSFFVRLFSFVSLLVVVLLFYYFFVSLTFYLFLTQFVMRSNKS